MTKYNSDEKINNFTNGGSDTKGGGKPPQGSDTRPFYQDNRDSRTGTFARGTESESKKPADGRPVDDRNKSYANNVRKPR
jgi:hypothetical protein